MAGVQNTEALTILEKKKRRDVLNNSLPPSGCGLRAFLCIPAAEQSAKGCLLQRDTCWPISEMPTVARCRCLPLVQDAAARNTSSAARPGGSAAVPDEHEWSQTCDHPDQYSRAAPAGRSGELRLMRQGAIVSVRLCPSLGAIRRQGRCGAGEGPAPGALSTRPAAPVGLGDTAPDRCRRRPRLLPDAASSCWPRSPPAPPSTPTTIRCSAMAPAAAAVLRRAD